MATTIVPSLARPVTQKNPTAVIPELRAARCAGPASRDHCRSNGGAEHRLSRPRRRLAVGRAAETGTGAGAPTLPAPAAAAGGTFGPTGPAGATGAAGDGVGGGPSGIDGPGAGAPVLGGGGKGAAAAGRAGGRRRLGWRRCGRGIEDGRGSGRLRDRSRAQRCGRLCWRDRCLGSSGRRLGHRLLKLGQLLLTAWWVRRRRYSARLVQAPKVSTGSTADLANDTRSRRRTGRAWGAGHSGNAGPTGDGGPCRGAALRRAEGMAGGDRTADSDPPPAVADLGPELGGFWVAGPGGGRIAGFRFPWPVEPAVEA